MSTEDVSVEEQRDEYKREADHWREAYLEMQELYWHIPKPHLSSPARATKDAVKRFMNQDMETVYKTYIVVAIMCAVVTALADVYSRTRRLYK